MSDNPSLDFDEQPVPYEDGDHCIFYAIQEASLFFNNKALTIDDRSEIQQKRVRMIKIAKEIIGKDIISLHYLTLSIRIVGEQLRSAGIDYTSFYCSQKVKMGIEGDSYIRRSNIPINEINGKLKLTYPVMIFTKREVGAHVWCATSDEKFKDDYSKNIARGDVIVLVANLKKQN